MQKVVHLCNNDFMKASCKEADQLSYVKTFCCLEYVYSAKRQWNYRFLMLIQLNRTDSFVFEYAMIAFPGIWSL